jgi:hypothetical protein
MVFKDDIPRQLIRIFTQVRRVGFIEVPKRLVYAVSEKLSCFFNIRAATGRGEIEFQSEELPRRYPSFLNVFLYVETLW